MGLHIVLLEPEIPQNTGNIARTCAATGTTLHLVGPLGFSLSDRYLKRAGLDYWDSVEIYSYEGGFDEVRLKYPKGNFYFATTKAHHVYSDIDYPEDTFLVFGKETAGIPEDLLSENIENCVRIPMKDSLRSLNLANSAAVIAYEYYRQKGFKDLQMAGKLTKGKD